MFVVVKVICQPQFFFFPLFDRFHNLEFFNCIANLRNLWFRERERKKKRERLRDKSLAQIEDDFIKVKKWH